MSSTSPLLPRQSLLTQSLQRLPTYDDADKSKNGVAQHKKSSSLDFLSRLSGDSLLESSDEVREREKRQRERKKKSWSFDKVNLNMGMARFGGGKGVREMI